jgi:hypothetical protein
MAPAIAGAIVGLSIAALAQVAGQFGGRAGFNIGAGKADPRLTSVPTTPLVASSRKTGLSAIGVPAR